MNPATEQRFKTRSKQALINLQYLSAGLQSILEKPELQQPEVAEFVANSIQYVDEERQAIARIEAELRRERLNHFYRVLALCGGAVFLCWQVVINLPPPPTAPAPPKIIRMQPPVGP